MFSQQGWAVTVSIPLFFVMQFSPTSQIGQGLLPPGADQISWLGPTNPPATLSRSVRLAIGFGHQKTTLMYAKNRQLPLTCSDSSPSSSAHREQEIAQLKDLTQQFTHLVRDPQTSSETRACCSGPMVDLTERMLELMKDDY